MSDKELLRKKKRLERQSAKIGIHCFNSLYYFFKTFWPEMSGDEYIDAPHLKYLCGVIQKEAMPVIRGEFSMETLVINVPPGSSKSTIATIAFPMWVWLRAPYLASANVSYSDALSARHAKKARAITDSDKWHMLFDNLFKLKHGKALKITTQNRNSIENNFKGERFNTSVDGSVTGMHADFFIKDDMQDPKQAKSDTIREHVNEWDEETLTSRHKRPQCYLDIVIAQRLHENDLCGNILNKNIPRTHICLPAELNTAAKVVPASAESVYTDRILDPHRRPKKVLEVIKSTMKSGPYTCQYLQAPFNLEEQDIKPDMFDIVEHYPADVVFDVWVDGAFTEKTENDPSGIDIIGKSGNDVIVKDSYDVYKKLPDLLAFLVELEKNRVFDKAKSRIFIEPKASGSPLADYLEHDTEYNFVRIGEHSKQESKLVQGGHVARHEVIKPKAESHRIKILKGTWNDSYITQICGFPKAAHDEHVDNLGYAINHYYFGENTFIENYALNHLERNVTGSIPIMLSSQIAGYKISTAYEENDAGDIQMFDSPNKLYNNRYICVLVLLSEGERGGKTSIVVLDRQDLTVAALYEGADLSAKKAGLKALKIAHLYDTAKLAVAVKKRTGNTQTEENDLSHMAIAEIRRVQYDNMYFRLTVNMIRKRREREYGFEIDKSGRREVYYNLKDYIEASKVSGLPLEVFNDIKLLERKRETGEIDSQEGHQTNSSLAYSIGLKIHDEMLDGVTVKKNKRW